MAANNITIVGNLTREPELRYTQGGKGVTSFGVAVSHRYQVNGEWQEKTSFFNVTAWDQLGENAAATLSKGSRVIVNGRIEVREYEARDGGKRTSVDVIADEIGPSLRWARATIERTTRTTADDGGQGGGGNFGGGGSYGGGGGNFGGGAAAPAGGGRAPDPVYGDEEPF
jgi:single-strand DNA-binding protein